MHDVTEMNRSDADTTMRTQERFKRSQTLLKTSLGHDVYTSWFPRLALEGIHDGVAHCSVPTAFLRHWIMSRYREQLISCLNAAELAVHSVECTIRTIRAYEAPDVRTEVCAPPLVPTAPSRSTIRSQHMDRGGSPLDARFSLEQFIRGSKNGLAYTAIMQIAEYPDELPQHNPLYIHGGAGFGKTHLLQGLCMHVATRRALYLTAEKFMSGLARSLKSQSALAFKEQLQGIDLLVIDDIQHLLGKSVQNELSHAIQALVGSGRQVIVSADRAPEELELFGDHLRGRFQSGLVLEIGPHEEEVRQGILEAKVRAAQAKHPRFEIPDNALEYLAHGCVRGGRALEGIVHTLVARFAQTNTPLTLESVQHEVRHLIQGDEPKRIMIEDIQRVVTRHYRISKNTLLSEDRTQKIVLPRQVAMYLSKLLTLRSLPEIGRRFGDRDHTTVMHAIRKIETLIARNREFAEEIEHLKRQLYA